MSAFDHFLGELCADPELAPCAPEIRRALDALSVEGDGNLDALVLEFAVEWIANRREHPLRERVGKISQLVALRGQQVINLREFCGW